MRKLTDFYIGAMDCKALVLNYELHSEKKRFIAVLKRDENLEILLRLENPMGFVRDNTGYEFWRIRASHKWFGENEIHIGISG